MNALKTAAAACVAAIALTAAPAFAGECPANQVVAAGAGGAHAHLTRAATVNVRYGAPGKNLPKLQRGSEQLENAPTMPSGVTDDVIASIDLTGRYGIDGRNLRLRRLVIQPGGIVPVHSHADRPANIYVVDGQVTEYSSACRVGVTHREGDVIAEQGDISHWWRNNSRRRAVLLSADIPPPAGNAQGGM